MIPAAEAIGRLSLPNIAHHALPLARTWLEQRSSMACALTPPVSKEACNDCFHAQAHLATCRQPSRRCPVRQTDLWAPRFGMVGAVYTSGGAACCSFPVIELLFPCAFLFQSLCYENIRLLYLVFRMIFSWPCTAKVSIETNLPDLRTRKVITRSDAPYKTVFLGRI